MKEIIYPFRYIGIFSYPDERCKVLVKDDLGNVRIQFESGLEVETQFWQLEKVDKAEIGE
jgi:hypothetical protein